MKLGKKLVLLTLSSLLIFSSCGRDNDENSLSYNDENSISIDTTSEDPTSTLVGEEISYEEARILLSKISSDFESKYDLDEEIPEEFMYLYVESEASGTIEGVNYTQTGFSYFSMEEGNMYSISQVKTSTSTDSETKMSYIVNTGDDSFTSWDVINGKVENLKEDGLVALGLVLVYAFLLASTLPNIPVEQIDEKGATPISFTKYSDLDIDCSYSVNVNNEEEENVEYVKEITNIQYRNGIAESILVERLDKDDKVVVTQKMKYSFEKKDYSKPSVPTVE